MGPYLCAALRKDLVKLELLSVSFLNNHHFLVVRRLQTGAGGCGHPAATEHPDVPLQLQQLVEQSLPLHRLLPVERSQLLHLLCCLLLSKGQLSHSGLQLFQLVLHVGQRLVNGGSKLLVGDIHLTGQTAHVAERPRSDGGLGNVLGGRHSRRLTIQERSDLLSRLLLVSLQLGQLLVQVLDDFVEVTYFPGQVAVPLEKIVHLLVFVSEFLLQIVDDPVPLQKGPARLR